MRYLIAAVLTGMALCWTYHEVFAMPMPPARDVVSVGIDAGGLWYLPKKEPGKGGRCISGFHASNGIWCYRDRVVDTSMQWPFPEPRGHAGARGEAPQIICVRDGYTRDCSKDEPRDDD